MLTFFTLEMNGYVEELPTEWTLRQLERCFKWGYFVACWEEALPHNTGLGDDLP